MFNVGDLITGNSSNIYGCTNERALCVVTKVYSERRIQVVIIGTPSMYDLDEAQYDVDSNRFDLTTMEDYMARVPNAMFINNIAKYTNATIKEEKKMELRMKKDATYKLTNEEKATLRQEIIDLLLEYDYEPTKYGVDAIIDEWVRNKGWMIELFKKHPNYNGKFQIVFDADYDRTVNKDLIHDFACYLNRVAEATYKLEKQFGCFTYSEVRKIYERLNEIVGCMRTIKYHNKYQDVLVNGRTMESLAKEKDEWYGTLCEMMPSVTIKGSKGYDKEKYEIFQNLKYLSYDVIFYNTDNLATEHFAAEINRLFPNVKAVAGQKVSRIINKLCKMLGIDKDPDYNREFAKYADAINPLAIKRHTILSVHPVDYLTMSFGNSWASCHTIDKENKRNTPGEHYRGCYSSGTLSYALDNSSFVFYTVSKEYTGNEYELQDKINRNMFHIGEDKLIQGRVYPQSTDGESGIYRKIREIAQKVIADCLGVPNMWTNVKGTGECNSVNYSYGTHYRDYESYSDCNVSYLKGDGDEAPNKKRIIIGHDPICPACGDTHEYAECVECECCYEDRHECYNCGCHADEEDMYEIDGRWYCCDCSFYCEYHNRREPNDEGYNHVRNYGDVCNDALDAGDFYTCERCGDIYEINDPCHPEIETSDGASYCSIRCAERDDYRLANDGIWYPGDEVYLCEHCNEYVHVSKWNDELECCCVCAATIESIEEDEERVGA